MTIQDGTTGPWFWNAADFTNGIINAAYITGTANKVPMPIGTAMRLERQLPVVGLQKHYCLRLRFALSPRSASRVFLQSMSGRTGCHCVRSLNMILPSPEQGVLVETDSGVCIVLYKVLSLTGQLGRLPVDSRPMLTPRWDWLRLAPLLTCTGCPGS